MSRFRMVPTAKQEVRLLTHCRDARYVWNLAVEQQQHWQQGGKSPGYVEQCAQLTEARVGAIGFVPEVRLFSNRRCGISIKQWSVTSEARIANRLGAKPACTKGFAR